MDSIISKLSEVESAAELIVQHAEEQKQILDEQMKEKTDKFDRELAADTEKKLSEIRAGMQGSMDSELERLREESAKRSMHTRENMSWSMSGMRRRL